jgi:prepilin-type N-terminal cleavage/methylation domain-containing protein
MHPSPASARTAFTLIELLTVIGIIALLAGMGFGVVSVVRKQAKVVQCTNNLKNLGTGIKAFQLDNSKNEFPGHLWELFEPGRALAGEAKEKMVICPFDAKKGTITLMGRPPSPPSTWSDLRYLHEPATSYLYELNSEPIVSNDDKDWFYDTRWPNPLPVPPNSLPVLNPPLWGEPMPAQPTWGQAKMNSFNSFIKQGVNGANLLKVRADSFPIIRDFHHFAWTGIQDEEGVKKVFNLALGFNVFWSVPQWENGYQP